MSDRSTRATILGQLGLRAWRAYDLVREMRRNLHYFWPRAESRIYATLNKLADEGHAHPETVHTGARAATMWEVTDAGRAAFEDWLHTPPSATHLDCEALVRIFLAPAPDHPAVRPAVAAIASEADELSALAVRIAQEYAEGRAPFQDQARVRALVFDFLSAWAAMRSAWATRATALLDAMDGASPDEARAQALAHIRARCAALGLEVPPAR